MANMRVIADNVALVASSLTSATTEATLPLTNMLNDRKSRVARSTGVNWSFEVNFSVDTLVKAVALAFTNLTPLATMRVRGYASSSATVGVTTALFDVTAALCCPAKLSTVRQDGLSNPALFGVNGFSQGYHSYAVRWFEGGTVRKIAIDISDSTNPAGYLEASRLIMGTYWSPQYNPDYGLQMVTQDTSKSERTDGSDSLTDRGIRFKRMSMNLSQMQSADREAFYDLLALHGTSRPLFISVFPEDSEPRKEQQYMVYGKFSQMSSITVPTYNRYNFPIEIEEV